MISAIATESLVTNNMKCSISLLVCVSIGVAAGQDIWKQNREYNYKVITTAATKSREDNWDGTVFQARLTIRPESDEILVGKFTRPELAKVQSSRRWDLDMTNTELKYNQLPLEQPFTIQLKDGVIKSVFTERQMTEDQIEQLKFVLNWVMNQFQVDKDVKNKMNSDGSVYTKNEPTLLGDCDTVYDVSQLADYLAQSSRDMVPLPEINKNEGGFVDIKKTRNYNKCTNSMGQLNNDMKDKSVIAEDSRIILSGASNDFTIQSTVATVKTADNLNDPPKSIYYISVTLESIESDTTSSKLPEVNRMYVENVVDNSSPSAGRNNASNRSEMSRENPMYRKELMLREFLLSRANFTSGENIRNNGPRVRLMPSEGVTGVSDAETRWSDCWTWFPSANSVCRGNFGAEWAGIETKNCGFLGLGHTVLCRRDFPGCESTTCYSPLVQNLCAEFGGRLPVHKGGFEDCSPGFYSWRCCSN